MGSFDDFNKISEICKKHGLWNHVDACWGGYLAFSDKNKHLFDGIDQTDSLTINPHKGQGIPM